MCCSQPRLGCTFPMSNKRAGVRAALSAQMAFAVDSALSYNFHRTHRNPCGVPPTLRLCVQAWRSPHYATHLVPRRFGRRRSSTESPLALLYFCSFMFRWKIFLHPFQALYDPWPLQTTPKTPPADLTLAFSHLETLTLKVSVHHSSFFIHSFYLQAFFLYKSQQRSANVVI